MKNTLESMKDILESTCRQLEDSLPSGEYLIFRFTVYDKKNSVSTNMFLTNQAIFLQESDDLETIKKRRFEKINNIKLTSTELYIEFINGYTIIGDIVSCLDEAKEFLEHIKKNTTIKTSSIDDLQAPMATEIRPINHHTAVPSHEKKDFNEVKEKTIDMLIPEEPISEPKKKKTKIGLIIGTITGLIVIIGAIFAIALLMKSPKEAPVDETAQIEIIQARADELLQYQLANNEFYDYVFEIQSQYEDISFDVASVNLVEAEQLITNLKSDFNEKYTSDFKSQNDLRAIYDSEKIDEWMNTNRQYVISIFDIFSDLLDSNFRNQTKMIELQKQLSDADGEIRKVQSILAEEKEGVKKALAAIKGEEYHEPTSNMTSTSTNTTTSSTTTSTTTKITDEFIDENDKNKIQDEDQESQGREDEASYVGTN